MTRLSDLLDVDLLAKHIAEGNVRMQTHPELPLRIYNYTAQAQYSGAWDEVTMTCRGLIIDGDDRVMARPFRKFFNHGQPGSPTIALDAPVSVTDKADGSLGILYPTPDGGAVATRGSFTSEQAVHATEVWQERYAGRCRPDSRLTYLFEIIYPANRIVLDYGNLDDLVLLGAVRIDDGTTVPADQFRWHGPIVDRLDHHTLADALAATPRPNAEGMVVHCRTTDERVKLKQEDYVALHRIITGLNARTVWEHLAAGQPLEVLLEGLPDEFHDWVADVAAQLWEQVSRQEREARGVFAGIMAALELPPGTVGRASREDRKRFAGLAVQHPLKWALFALLDGKDIEAGLWKGARPEAGWTPAGRIYSEDTA